MAKKIFVTGAQGFVGQKLTVFLKKNNFEVFGYTGKLEEYDELSKSLQSFSPNVVIHLAALSNVPFCEKHPAEAYFSNVAGTAILLESLQKLLIKPSLIFASSAQIYNLQSLAVSEKTIDENFEIGPNNVYGRTKLQGEWLIRETVKQLGIKAVVLRLFNHSHKDQEPSFFLPSMYQQISSIKESGQIKVGNLDVARDFGLVSDLLNAFLSAINKINSFDSIETFNISSGQGRNLKELVLAIGNQLGKKIELEVDPSRFRSGEAQSVVGNSNWFQEKTGWKPSKCSAAQYINLFLA